MTRRTTAGSKIRRLLERNADAGRKPGNQSELARAIGVDQGTVCEWCAHGAGMRAGAGLRAAVALAVDPAWLLDDARPWPPPAGAGALAGLARVVPRAEQDDLAAAMSDPRFRRMALAMWRAR